MKIRGKRLFATCLILASVLCTMTGCSDAEVESLRKIEALNGESEFSNVNMSVSEKEAAVYTQVSNRTLLDLTALADVPDGDLQTVLGYMDSFDAQLCGSLEKRIIDDCYTDYLLMEFQKTPFYWQRTKTQVLGMDSASRSIVLDVTYNTIDFRKDIQQDSTIVQGEPNYTQLMSIRYERWMNILKLKYGYNNNKTTYESMLAEFESVYGDVDSIINSQRNDSLTDSIYTTGNQKTYTGLVDSDMEQLGASMTVRFILVPTYTLGINQGYTCRHMYVTSYALESDPTKQLALDKDSDTFAIASSIYSTLNRYYICKDENNFSGLYKLTDNFGSLDKHFEDLFDTTYRKHDNFDLSIFSVKGTKIECGVSVSTKIRPKGSNISLPIYTDRYYYTIELIDGELKVTNEVLLSRVIEGEPAIDTTEISTTGFSSNITLTDDDRRSIETLIADMGAQQLLNDTISDNFNALIDLSLSQSQVDTIKTRASYFSGKNKKKAVWLTSYLVGHNNYASVKCSELYQADDNSVTETETTYDFIKKGGSWYIYDFSYTAPVKLDTETLTTKNSLCVCSAGKVDSFVSQVEFIESEEVGTDDEVTIHSITHDKYTPFLKNGYVPPVVDSSEESSTDKEEELNNKEESTESDTTDKTNEADASEESKEPEVTTTVNT